MVDDAAGVEGTTILVVEDDGTIRDLIETVLARSGARVLLAASAEEAVATAAAEPQLDLLLTDLLLPGASGRELAMQLRPMHPALKVIYMTGWREHASLDGIPDAVVLSKPFQLKELARVVASALGRDGET